MSSLEQIASQGRLAARGWLDIAILNAHYCHNSLGLLTSLKNIQNSPKGPEKIRLIKVVSLNLLSCLPEELQEYVESLGSNRRTEVTRGLWRLLVPNGTHRFNI